MVQLASFRIGSLMPLFSSAKAMKLSMAMEFHCSRSSSCSDPVKVPSGNSSIVSMEAKNSLRVMLLRS